MQRCCHGNMLVLFNQQAFLGTMPVAMQFDTWSDTPNQQKWAAALKSMAESIQNIFGKKQGRSLRSQVRPSSQNGGLHRHQHFVPAFYQQQRTLSEQFALQGGEDG